MKCWVFSLVLMNFLPVLFAFGERGDAIDGPNSESGVAGSDYLRDFKEQLELQWPKNKTINVVFHGHSVPSGYFVAPRVRTLDAYPHLFLRYLKENYPNAVINCITTSIGGENSQQGANRFKEDVLVMKPDVLFIDYGLNDRGIGLEKAEASWRRMIEYALAAGVKAILFTPTPDLNEDILDENAPLVDHAGMIRMLGEDYAIPVVDTYARFKSLRESGCELSKYMAQKNHPNALGHAEVLKEMVSTLFAELPSYNPD